MIRTFFGDIVQIRPEQQNGNPPAEIPAVVVSGDTTNEHMPNIIICPLLETRQSFPSRIGATFIPRSLSGLEKNALLLYFQIRAIPKNMVSRRLGALPPAYLSQVKESLKAIFDIE